MRWRISSNLKSRMASTPPKARSFETACRRSWRNGKLAVANRGARLKRDESRSVAGNLCKPIACDTRARTQKGRWKKVMPHTVISHLKLRSNWSRSTNIFPWQFRRKSPSITRSPLLCIVKACKISHTEARVATMFAPDSA